MWLYKNIFLADQSSDFSDDYNPFASDTDIEPDFVSFEMLILINKLNNGIKKTSLHESLLYLRFIRYQHNHFVLPLQKTSSPKQSEELVDASVSFYDKLD